MKKLVISSDQLPGHLSNRQRFLLWRDMWADHLGAADMMHDDERPFSVRSEILPFGKAGVFRLETTTDEWSRGRRHISADGCEDVMIYFSRSRGANRMEGAGREVTIRAGDAIAHSLGLPSVSRTGGHISWVCVGAPRDSILTRVAGTDDKMLTLLDRSNPALRHLERYANFLLDAEEIGDVPVLDERVGEALLDLLALALGAKGEMAEFASARGLRAARLRDVLYEIHGGFARPDFSPAAVARKLGLSPRYIQDLLQETGRSFTERVLELRLQKTSTMLMDRRNDRLKISEIAFSAGFGDVSYFNQAFRRRFGCSPTQYRSGNGAG